MTKITEALAKKTAVRTEEWYGFQRFHFTFEGYNAWIAEPRYPTGDGRWSWCMVWPEAFVKRVGIVALLEHGFHHVHIDLFETKANPEGVRIMSRFHDFLISLGLAEKTNLIGMSWGGFFSLRYAAENPGRIAALYLDAPVCNASDEGPSITTETRNQAISTQFGISHEELKTSPLNPLNHLDSIVQAGFPILCVAGQEDTSVNIHTNLDELEKRILEAGGKLRVIRRNFWGHHPHGLDDPEEILAIHCEALLR